MKMRGRKNMAGNPGDYSLERESRIFSGLGKKAEGCWPQPTSKGAPRRHRDTETRSETGKGSSGVAWHGESSSVVDLLPNGSRPAAFDEVVPCDGHGRGHHPGRINLHSAFRNYAADTQHAWGTAG